MTLRLTRLQKNLKIADADGTPTPQFMAFDQKMKESIEAAFGDLENQLAQILASYRETARINSYPDPTNVLTATDETVGASITIAAHTRVYPVQGTIDVPDVVIPAPVTLTVEDDGTTGIVNSVQYSVGYRDATLADTTPAYFAVRTATRHAEVQPGAEAGMHFLGTVTTPANGAGGTTGVGGGPPGGGGGEPIP